MKKFIVILGFLFLTSFAIAEEVDVTQNIKNEKGFASINLDSQITPDGKIKRQTISNNRSAFNININRNTYKFYVLEKEVNK